MRLCQLRPGLLLQLPQLQRRRAPQWRRAAEGVQAVPRQADGVRLCIVTITSPAVVELLFCEVFSPKTCTTVCEAVLSGVSVV